MLQAHGYFFYHAFCIQEASSLIRDAMSTPFKNTRYSMQVDHSVLNLAGDVFTVSETEDLTGYVEPNAYPFSI